MTTGRPVACRAGAAALVTKGSLALERLPDADRTAIDAHASGQVPAPAGAEATDVPAA
jgi:hypothetical protein